MDICIAKIYGLRQCKRWALWLSVRTDTACEQNFKQKGWELDTRGHASAAGWHLPRVMKAWALTTGGMADPLNWESGWEDGISSRSGELDTGKEQVRNENVLFRQTVLPVNSKLKAVRREPHVGPRWQKKPEWTESKERRVSPLWLDTAVQPHPRWRGVSPTEKKQHCSHKATAEL